MKTSKEKAVELIEFFKPLVYCYMGSGMLSNDYDEKVVLENTKKCAVKCVEEIIESMPIAESLNYYKNIIKEIELL